jgi:hypothetical protein
MGFEGGKSHRPCGESCLHLKRFFKRLGFITKFYSKRKELKASKQ